MDQSKVDIEVRRSDLPQALAIVGVLRRTHPEYFLDLKKRAAKP